MRLRLIVIPLILLILTPALNGQIENEIRAYIDSTQLMVTNGHKMLEACIHEGDLNKAAEIYDYLTRFTHDKTRKAFSYREEVWLNTLFGRWESLADLLERYSDLSSRLTFSYYSAILPSISNQMREHEQSLRSGYMNSGLDAESLDLFDMLFHLILEGGRNVEYNTLFNSFRKSYPESRYREAIKRYFPDRYIRVAMGFSIGSGVLLPQGALGQNTGDGIAGMMSLDLPIGRVYASLYFQSGSLKLKEPYDVIDSEEILTFMPDEKFQYLDGGVRAGFLAVRNSRLQVAPFITIGGASLESKRYGPSENDKEFKALSSFIYGPGLHTEVRLTGFDPYRTGGLTYVSLKLEGGLNIVAKSHHEHFRGNMAWINAALLFGLGEF